MRGTWKSLAIAGTLAVIVLPAWSPAQAGSKNSRTIVIDDDPVVVAENEAEHGKGAYLGVQLREEVKSPEGGARVVAVVPDSPADKAGIKEGDVIVGLGDAVIRGPMSLTERLRDKHSGDKVAVAVVRDGRKETLSVQLGEKPKHAARTLVLPGGETMEIPEVDRDQLNLDLRRLQDELPRLKGELKHLGVAPGRNRGLQLFLSQNRPRLGVELIEATPEFREFLYGKRDSGVIVGKVLEGSVAESAGIKVGDLIVAVNGTDVKEAGDLIEAISDVEGGPVQLDVIRDRKPIKIKAVLPKENEEENEHAVGPRAKLRLRSHCPSLACPVRLVAPWPDPGRRFGSDVGPV